MESNSAKKASDDYRYERKALVSIIDLHEIEMYVKCHFSLLQKSYPDRFINNIYFDTYDFQSYSDNIEGAHDRVKLRIRWYGELFQKNINPVLEYKIKKGFVGTKHSYPLASMDFNRDFTKSDLWDVIRRSDLPDKVRLDITKLTPLLVNRYKKKIL